MMMTITRSSRIFAIGSLTSYTLTANMVSSITVMMIHLLFFFSL